MDLPFFKVDDETALTVSNWVSIIAILISLVGAYLTHVFSNRVNAKTGVEIAKSNELAANANQRTEELRSDNLKLGLQLENERIARLDIERRLADRFISDKERQIIAEAIEPFRLHSIMITAIGNPESELYAKQLIALFAGAGWRVDTHVGSLMGPPQYGLFLLVPKEPGKAAQALISALNKAGIIFKQQIDDRLTPEGIELRVGDKNPNEAVKSVR
jgi:hypothetical protein